MKLVASQSHRTKRIVKSSLVAEAMALIEASGKTFWIRCIINEIFLNIATPIICLIDSRILHYAVKSSKQIVDSLA